MEKQLQLKIVEHCLQTLLDHKDDENHIASNDEKKVYATWKTALDLSVPIEAVEHSIESYRKGELF